MRLVIQKYPCGENKKSYTGSNDIKYFDYKLVYKDFVIKEVRGYNSFYGHVENNEKVEREIVSYAYNFATVFNLNIPPIVTMKSQMVKKLEWIEEENT